MVIEAISDSDDEYGQASGVVYDAKTGRTVSGITVYIREGVNNLTGEELLVLESNSNGVYTTDDLCPGNYTAEFVDERNISDEDMRYGSVAIAIKVLPDRMISNQNVTISNKMGMTASGMRIVLTWGSSPSDLDSHFYANTESVTYHVYFADKNHADANLDVDDTSSYGPETVTVEEFEDGVYRYYVHDYTNRLSSNNTALANSGACVKVYLDSSNVPTYTFYVPGGTGTYWHVFDYDYTAGEFIVVNQIGNSASYPEAYDLFGVLSEETVYEK